MSENQYQFDSRVSMRTNIRRQRILSSISFPIPQDRPMVIPQPRELNSDNSSTEISINVLESSQSEINFANSDNASDQQNENYFGEDDYNAVDEENTDEFNFEQEFIDIILAHSISYVAAEKIIDLINNEFGYKRLPKSMKTLLRRIDSEVFDFDFTFVCKCGSTLKYQSKNGRFLTKVSCNTCRKTFNNYKELSEYPYYCTLPIKSQIIRLAETYSHPNNLSQSGQEGILYLDILLAVDAIPIYKSTSSSLHVMMVFVDKMKQRGKDAIPIVSTLFYGPHKPDVFFFFKTFIDEYHELSNSSFQTKWASETRLKLIGILADAPCRAWILGMHQFNGTYGCHRCYIKTIAGKYLPTKYDTLKLRTTAETEGIRASLCNNTHIMGVIRPTPLSHLREFDYIKNTAVEYIHCGILGVVKNILKSVMLDSAWGNNMFVNNNRPSIQYFVEKFNQIRPPSCFKRFRDFSEITNYKSSEFENFLFYFSYPILKSRLKNEYLVHFLLLSSAMYKILSKNDDESRQQTHSDIDRFNQLIYELEYPEDMYKYNTHSLHHLAEDNFSFGKLKHYNAYCYENFLGQLKSLVRYPINIPQQVMCQVKVMGIAKSQSESFVFKTEVLTETNPSLQDCLQILSFNEPSSKYYLKCKTRTSKFTSIHYSTMFKKDDSNLNINDKYYQIQFFVDTPTRKYIILKEWIKGSNLVCRSPHAEVSLSYVHFVKLDTRLTIVPFPKLLLPLLIVNTTNNTLAYELITSNK